ncbi:unnamed protein product [Penicillium palitans]
MELEYPYDPSRPLPDITMEYQYKISNCPGKTVIGVRIAYPPNGAAAPHRHGTASVAGYVVSGTVHNKMNNDPVKVYTTGGTWYEAPGCHHRISDNASKTEPAVLLATVIVDTDVFERDGMDAIIQIDKEYL